jgi:hypothetical protein
VTVARLEASRLAADALRDEASANADARQDRAVRAWLVFALFASIFLQRFALPIGPDGIGLNLLFTLVALAAIGVRGGLGVDPLRVALACAFLACVWFSLALNAGHASVPSAALVLLIYAPYALTLRRREGVFEACIGAFQAMVLVCAVAGIVQFLAQFVLDPALLFTFHGFLPDPILLKGWGNVQPLQWGGSIYKANGFFLNEPSTFSQYLALGIIIEILFFGRLWRLVVLGVAVLLSYSGTGLILLVTMLPFALLHARAYKALFGLLVLGVVAIALGDLWQMQALIGRVTEFGSGGSSATARYQAGAWLIAWYVLPWPPDLLFGLGPGSFLDTARLQSFEAHDGTLWKLVFEYGLVGSLAFWLMFGVLLFDRVPSRWIAVALGIGFVAFGGMLLDPRLQVLILLFCTLTKLPATTLPARLRLVASR